MNMAVLKTSMGRPAIGHGVEREAEQVSVRLLDFDDRRVEKRQCLNEKRPADVAGRILRFLERPPVRDFKTR